MYNWIADGPQRFDKSKVFDTGFYLLRIIPSQLISKLSSLQLFSMCIDDSFSYIGGKHLVGELDC